MSDKKYRQISSQKNNCQQGHWTGIPKGGSGTGCWLCQYGCAVLSYLYWKGKEPNKENVEACLNQNADADWGKMGISKKTTIQTPCIGRFKSKSHFVYIKSKDDNGNCSIFDPGKRSNTSMKESEFSCFYY
jgi:hypothetical protein